MDRLSELENQSVYIIREAYARHRSMALLWSMGKDSTALLWMCRKAFLDRIPFPVLHIDTSYKFPEMYEYRDRLAAKLGLNLIVHRNEEALADGWNHDRGVIECCGKLKTEALKQAVQRHRFDAIILGIRRDEHGIRAKERIFSPRDAEFQWDYQNQPAELWNLYNSKSEREDHLRVHPLLGWTERDVWEYIRRESIPVNRLYFSREGRRYRSLGCMTCTVTVDSQASSVEEIVDEVATSRIGERAGRAQDKETSYTMQKLRSLGYM